VDGSAGVRNSRENMEGVIEMDERREDERRWKRGVVVMNKKIKLSSMVRGERELNSIACKPGRCYHPGLIVTR